MSTPLTDFLQFLVEDDDALDAFNTGVSEANQVMNNHGQGLSSAQRSALLNHDVAAIYQFLVAEQYEDWPFRIAAGPTKGEYEDDFLFFVHRAPPTKVMGLRPPPPGPGRPKPGKTAGGRKPKPPARASSAGTRRKATKKVSRRPKKR